VHQDLVAPVPDLGELLEGGVVDADRCRGARVIDARYVGRGPGTHAATLVLPPHHAQPTASQATNSRLAAMWGPVASPTSRPTDSFTGNEQSAGRDVGPRCFPHI